MASSDGTTTETETEAPPEDGTTSERLGHLEQAVERIEHAIAAIVPGSREEAGERVEARLDRPSSVEEQVRAELARAREEEQRAAAEESGRAAHEDHATRLAKLEEKPPQQPIRWATKTLGWKQ